MVSEVSWISFAFISVITPTAYLALSLAMPRHFRVWFNREATDRESLIYRTGGWTLLLIAATACVYIWGFSVGIVALCGFSTLAALFVVLATTFVPPWLKGH